MWRKKLSFLDRQVGDAESLALQIPQIYEGRKWVTGEELLTEAIGSEVVGDIDENLAKRLLYKWLDEVVIALLRGEGVDVPGLGRLSLRRTRPCIEIHRDRGSEAVQTLVDSSLVIGIDVGPFIGAVLKKWNSAIAILGRSKKIGREGGALQDTRAAEAQYEILTALVRIEAADAELGVVKKRKKRPGRRMVTNDGVQKSFW